VGLLLKLTDGRPVTRHSTVETAEGWCVQAFAREGGDGDGGVPELRLPVR